MKGLLARLAKAIVALGNITTDKGILSWDGEDDLKAGDAVFIEKEDGTRAPATDGDYTTEDGKVVVVVDGKVAEIKDAQAEVAPEEAPDTQEEEAAAVKAVETDKGKLEWDNEDEDLKEGDAVYITDEEGNRNPAPDGEYTTEDGKVISVVDGKVASITDPKAEVAEEEAQKFARIREAFSASYTEKQQKIYDAIKALGFEGWLVDAGDDFAVLASWGDEKFNRFAIEWDTEGNAIASNPTLVVPAFVTPEERDAADAEFSAVKTEKEALASQVAELTAQVEALRKAPAAQPAHEAFQEQGAKTRTGRKGLDRIADLMGV